MKRALAIAGMFIVAGAAVFAFLRREPLPAAVVEISVRDVREFIAEEAKTRLKDEYIIDAPVNGAVERIALEVGDYVEKDQVVAQIDPFDLRVQATQIHALIAQARARIAGVDIAKPKPQELAAARTQVEEARINAAHMREQVAAAEADFKLADIEYARTKRLFDDEIVSRSAHDAAFARFESARDQLESLRLQTEAAAKSADIARLASEQLAESIDDNEYQRDIYRAEVDNLQAQLDGLERDLQRTAVKAPAAGVILEKPVEGPREIAIGTPLLRIGDLSTIEIESDVLSEEVVGVRAGNAVEITGEALGDRIVSGEVVRIYPSGFKKISALGIEQQRVKVIIGFDNSGLELRPGTSLDVRIITAEHKETLAAPDRAIFKHDNDWAVFVVRDGKARLTPIKVGLRNDEWAEILEGLSARELVIAEPSNDLEDEIPIEPLD